MASVWLGSSTFLYGALILPMSAYLIWRQRHSWLRLVEGVSPISILVLAAFVMLWTVSTLVSVQAARQFAVVGMLVALIWAALGTQAVGTLRFPLLYAFLAVPFGEFLIPPLMEWTAFAAVRALQVTGVPVLREGMQFALPSGNFEVVEACSGIRFLLVTVVLGAYYAYETFASRKKQILFIACAALTIVLTNGIRAYVVVLVAHYTDMRWGTGQSHLIIGGLIFLTVITTMFWFGRKFSDVPTEQQQDWHNDSTRASEAHIAGRVAVSFVAIAMLFAGPLLVRASQDRLAITLPEPRLPVSQASWSGPFAPALGYSLRLSAGPKLVAGEYADGEGTVEIHAAFFTDQRQGSELVGWDSRVADGDVWRETGRTMTTVPGLDTAVRVQAIEIERGSQRLLLWRWFDVGGHVTARPVIAKLLQTWNLLRGIREGDGLHGDGLVVLATAVERGDGNRSRERLAQYAAKHFQPISRCLRPGSSDAQCVILQNTEGMVY